MITYTIAQIAEIVGAESVNNNAEIRGFCIDSRKLARGNLFIAIPGTQVDGHSYVEDALKKGAHAALVTRKMDCPLPQIQVPDIFAALGKLSAAWRNQFDIPFIAVTGSNGKTTLKNMIASIMTAACLGDETKVLATQGNLNNHMGLPLTLGRLNANHRYAVIEMGMNHHGEIEYLTKLTRPSVAVINNAAAAHLEGVGDVEGVARAKAEIFKGLVPNGIAILNRDDAFYTYWREIIGKHQYITFGFHPDADISAIVEEAGEEMQRIHLHTPRGNIDVNLPLLGRHNVLNTLAAAAATMGIGINLQDIKTGLEIIKPATGRLQVHNLPNNVKVIDDTYTANPNSLQAAVNTLATFNGKKILVLGDMKELGSEARKVHEESGKAIREAGIDNLFTYGDLSANSSLAFGEGAYHFNEQEKLVNALKPFLHAPVTILIKGSRSMHMERVIAGLKE
jgi:UDP-N-acetylmuramoyl-tripeptide--D-alanyl-D-alanine ligase